MNLFRKVTVIALLVTVVVACKNNSEPEVKTIQVETSEKNIASVIDSDANLAKVEFNIKGMTCAMGCAKTIEKKMAKMEGVKMAKVDFDKELAMVEYDEAKVTPASLEEAVTKVSDIYKVEDLKIVESFSTEKKPCKEDCKMECCKDKKAEDKMACAKDCKKECCKTKES